MSDQAPYYLIKLKEVFASRQRVNPAYSLRAFARHLDLNASTLSAVLKGKRGLPRKTIPTVAKQLKLSPVERAQFVISLQRASSMWPTPTAPSTRVLSDELHHVIISEWEHFAILALMDAVDFESSTDWIARRLNISRWRVDSCLQHLIESQLIVRAKDESLSKTHAQFTTSDDVMSLALQKSHTESLQIAQQKLEAIPLNQRDFSSVMVTLSADHIALAKTLIRNFRKDFMALVEQTPGREVFQLNLQFFPLTNLTPATAAQNTKGEFHVHSTSHA